MPSTRLAVTGLLLAFASLVPLACGGDDSVSPAADGDSKADLLPAGGSVPPQETTDLKAAVRAADCRLTESQVDSRDHTDDIAEPVRYPTDPPTSGLHFQMPAEDGMYFEAPADTALVHSFEHGRVGIWYDPKLPREQRAALRALFEEDPQQLVVVPRRGTQYDVAASAWNRVPEPLGVGRLLVCEELTDEAYDALRAFRDKHRGQGPEPIP